MKVCKYCQQEKPDEDFTIPDWKSICRECYRLATIERQKKSYQRLKEKRLEYQRKYDTQTKEQRREYKIKYAREWRKRNPNYQKEYRQKRKTA